MNREFEIVDNGDGSQWLIPAEMSAEEWAALLPAQRHLHLWAVGNVADEAPPRPRCLARRICAGIWYLATGCGRGFARP